MDERIKIMSLNHVTISGNLTRDAELRTTNGAGTPVLNFSVACNDRRKNQQTGEWEDYPNFFDCSLFGRRAEALKDMLHKGTKVTISGKLRQSTWNDKETGAKRSSVSILVEELEFMSARNGGGSNGSGASAGGNDYDEDAPF